MKQTVGHAFCTRVQKHAIPSCHHGMRSGTWHLAQNLNSATDKGTGQRAVDLRCGVVPRGGRPRRGHGIATENGRARRSGTRFVGATRRREACAMSCWTDDLPPREISPPSDPLPGTRSNVSMASRKHSQNKMAFICSKK